MSNEVIQCYYCDGSGNDLTYSDKTCVLCKGRKSIPSMIVVCRHCGHLKDSHNGDYSFTGSPTECSEEISDDGTTCACVGASDSFVTAKQRLAEIQQVKTDRREKLISEHKATPDPP